MTGNSPEDPSRGAPYREALPKAVRYVCIVCFKTATTDEPGVCSCSGAGRLPIDNLEVLEELRKRVVKVRARRLAWKVGAAVVAAIALALAISLTFHLGIDDDQATFRAGSSAFQWLAFLFFMGFSALVTFTEPKLPTSVPGMLRWLNVAVLAR